jgi:uncharacterized protein YegL
MENDMRHAGKDAYTPLLVFMTDGTPTDNPSDEFKDIRERVSVCEDLMGIKERHAMALEIEFGRPWKCVEIREVTE